MSIGRLKHLPRVPLLPPIGWCRNNNLLSIAIGLGLRLRPD